MKDAKGHGSEKRGLHSGGVNKIGLPQPNELNLHPRVLKTITKNPGGFSVKPKTGAMPASGYMVSIPGGTRIVSEADLSGPHGAKLVQQYANDMAAPLSHPDAHIGGWTDKGTGKTYLDISHNVQSRSKAISLGKRNNQIAIWDVKRGREIRTGGTGE